MLNSMDTLGLFNGESVFTYTAVNKTDRIIYIPSINHRAEK